MIFLLLLLGYFVSFFLIFVILPLRLESFAFLIDSVESFFMYLFNFLWIVLIIVIFWRRHSKKEKLNAVFLNEIISDFAGKVSYIDKKTNVIYLRSFNYETRGGTEWVVTENGISISPNSTDTKVSILFNSIHNIILHPNQLSFETTVNRDETSRYHTIIFHAFDFHIAQAIQDRILGKSTRLVEGTQTNQSIAKDLNELNQLLYSRLISQEEFEREKTKLLNP